MSFDLKIINGDLSLKDGRLQTVSNTEKLIQDILKTILTPIGSNPAFPSYGSLISKNLIGNYLDSEIVEYIAKSQIEDSIKLLMDLQRIQRSKNQKISPEEHIAAISSITVEKAIQDPRIINIFIKVLSKSLTPVTTSFNLST